MGAVRPRPAPHQRIRLRRLTPSRHVFPALPLEPASTGPEPPGLPHPHRPRPRSPVAADPRRPGRGHRHARRSDQHGQPVPAGPQAPALRTQGPSRRAFLPQWRAVAGGHLRPQAGPREIRRPTPAGRVPPHRAQDRRSPALALQVLALRSKRPRDQRGLRAHRRACRRHRRHPLHARAGAQSRALAHAHELRRQRAAAPELRILGAVWARHREPELARLRLAVPRRLAHQGLRELAVGLPARRVPRNVRRSAAPRGRSAHREHPQPARHPRHAAPTTRPARLAERRSPAQPCLGSPTRGAHRVLRAGLPHANGGQRRLRLVSRARVRPGDVRRHRPRPTDPDRPAVARARGAGRSALARGRTALGSPRQHRVERAQAGRRDRRSHRRLHDRPQAARSLRRHAHPLGR